MLPRSQTGNVGSVLTEFQRKQEYLPIGFLVTIGIALWRPNIANILGILENHRVADESIFFCFRTLIIRWFLVYKDSISPV
jgi:hypothetical protein